GPPAQSLVWVYCAVRVLERNGDLLASPAMLNFTLVVTWFSESISKAIRLSYLVNDLYGRLTNVAGLSPLRLHEHVTAALHDVGCNGSCGLLDQFKQFAHTTASENV